MLLFSVCLACRLQCLPVEAMTDKAPHPPSTLSYDTPELLIKFKENISLPAIEKILRSRRMFHTFQITTLKHAPYWLRVDIHEGFPCKYRTGGVLPRFTIEMFSENGCYLVKY